VFQRRNESHMQLSGKYLKLSSVLENILQCDLINYYNCVIKQADKKIFTNHVVAHSRVRIFKLEHRYIIESCETTLSEHDFEC
jgi:hypothetical protein